MGIVWDLEGDFTQNLGGVFAQEPDSVQAPSTGMNNWSDCGRMGEEQQNE